jgi:hypothetical protein
MPAIVPIVEGQSEKESVPILLRRLLDRWQTHDIQVSRPFRVKRTQVVREGELERAVKQAVRDREGAAAVLVLLGVDNDCPADLGPRLLQRASRATNLPVAVFLARMEFEAWFLGAKESLRGNRGIRKDAASPPDPEAVAGAKERLSRNMDRQRYLEGDDQPAFAQAFDIDAAGRRCPSFGRFVRKVRGLVEEIHSRR